MKYMTFNRSCSYAGIADLLEDYDIHYDKNIKRFMLGIITKNINDSEHLLCRVNP